MAQARVLLVEDNASIHLIVKAAIGTTCDLKMVTDIKSAEKELSGPSTFSLLILDVMLPDGDGFAFCERLKSQERFNDLGIIFLTGKTDVEDRVHGFSLGADDYIVKPLEPKEFAARVEAKLRRKPQIKLQTHLRKSNFEADLVGQRIHRIGADGSRQDLLLTPIEFKLFVHFLQNEGCILSRKDLVVTVWGNSTHVADHTVDTHISTLRKKIGDSAAYLKAVLKKGYCYTSKEEEA